MSPFESDAQFAAALAESCERWRSGEPLDAVIASYPLEYRDELAQLVPLSGRVDVLQRDPSLDFRAALEDRLLQAVDEARSAGRRSVWRRAFEWWPSSRAMQLASVALLLLVFFGGSGAAVTAASAESLPGSPLYEVRKAREWVALTFARGDEAQVGTQAGRLDQRGADLERALNRGKSRGTIDELVGSAANSATKMVTAALALRANGHPQPAARALAAIQQEERRIEALEQRAPPNRRPSFEYLRNVLHTLELRLLEGNVGR
jgi:hypothetical protein